MRFFEFLHLTIVAYLLSFLLISPTFATEVTNKVAGDLCYEQAENSFLNFELDQASTAVDECLADFEKNPGISGGLFKAYLLKTQIAFERGQANIATENTQKAIALNLSTSSLNENDYSPKLRRFYEQELQKYKTANPIVNLTIEVKQNKEAPVYINGLLRGYGPQLVVPIAANELQIVLAGTNPMNSATKVITKENKTIHIANKDKTEKPKKKINKTVLWTIAGVVAAGLITGVILAVTGGANAQDVPVTISGPQPN